MGLFLEEKGSGLYYGHANAFTAGKKKKYQILHFKNFCGLNFEAREGCPLEFAVGQTPRWIILPLPNSYSLTDDDR